MGISSRIVHLKTTVKEDVTFPLFTPNDVTLLFSDMERQAALVINHNNATGA